MREILRTVRKEEMNFSLCIFAGRAPVNGVFVVVALPSVSRSDAVRKVHPSLGDLREAIFVDAINDRTPNRRIRTVIFGE